MEMQQQWDILNVRNKTKKDAVWTFDSKPYGVPAGKTKPMPRFLAELITKHLPEMVEIIKEEEEKKEEKSVPVIPEGVSAQIIESKTSRKKK